MAAALISPRNRVIGSGLTASSRDVQGGGKSREVDRSAVAFYRGLKNIYTSRHERATRGTAAIIRSICERTTGHGYCASVRLVNPLPPGELIINLLNNTAMLYHERPLRAGKSPLCHCYGCGLFSVCNGELRPALKLPSN